MNYKIYLLSLLVFYHFPPSFAFPFSESKAKEFWYYQVASLCSQYNLLKWNVSSVSALYPSITNIEVFYNSSGSNLAYTAYNPEENLIYMVFRRTVDWKNWIEDSELFLRDYENCDGCLVHMGFYEAYLNVKEDVLLSFKQLKSKFPDAKTAVIGHSLGAAISTFAFIDVLKEIGQLDYFYTFGSPRVGNKEFSYYVNSLGGNCNRARITHFRDATPHIPLNLMGYLHVSDEVYYNEDSSEFVVCERESVCA